MRPSEFAVGTSRRRVVVLLSAAISVAITGCSTVTPSLTLNLVNAASAVSAAAVAYSPTSSKEIVHHGDAVPRTVCILFNPEVHLQDFVPALQNELREHQVQSRVFDTEAPRAECAVWLHYAAQLEWSNLPLTDSTQAYLRRASLTLRRADGRFMSTASFELSPYFSFAKWAPTRRKLAPAVKSLLTGFSS